MLSSAQLKDAFESYDKDKSGTLEMDEIVKLAGSLGVKTTKEDLIKLFSSIDVDKDNKLSFDEFIGWYRVGRNEKLAGALKYELNTQHAAKLISRFSKNSTANGNKTTVLEVELSDGVGGAANTGSGSFLNISLIDEGSTSIILL
jgi:hypothetical protein